MKIAYILFNGLTVLDFVGIYDAIRRVRAFLYIPDFDWDVCWFTDKVVDNFGLELRPNSVRNDLGGYNVINVPGGFGKRKLQFDTEFMDWFKTSASVKTKTSVCTGSLLLGAAGYLKNKRATTNYQFYQELKPYCKTVVE